MTAQFASGRPDFPALSFALRIRDGWAFFPLPRLRTPQSMQWIVLATIWVGSIVMNENVGGPGFGLLDLALAANGGVLSLLVCFLFIPGYLETGRFPAFAAATCLATAAFGTVHIHVIVPLLKLDTAHAHSCYHCYLMQSLPTVATMAAVKLAWSTLEHQKQAALVARERSDSELRFLRAQMNPHLLFNILNNVYSYALERSDRAPHLILQLSGVLRYMLYEAGDEMVSLRRELDYIRDYFELQQLATEGRGEVRLQIVGDPAHYRIAPLLLVVFIENCFKHAVETAGPITVQVAIGIKNGNLMLEAENNLPNPTAQPGAPRPGGIGLENVRRRLELLYPGRFELEAGTLEKLFRIRLKLILAA